MTNRIGQLEAKVNDLVIERQRLLGELDEINDGNRQSKEMSDETKRILRSLVEQNKFKAQQIGKFSAFILSW